MRGADDHDAHVHAEVEDLEDLRVAERQHDDAAELGERDAAKHLRGEASRFA